MDTAALATFTAAGRTLAGAADAAAQRTALGLGTLAQQDASAVAITGGAISLGGHASTGVLDVQGSVVASDQSNQYNTVRLWPVVPSGATVVRGINLEPATGAGLAGAGFRGINISEQPAMASAYALNLNISAGSNRYNLFVPGTADNYFAGPLSFAAAAASTTRANLGLGTMAQQDASAVAITGGSATALTQMFADGVSSIRLNVEGKGFICRDYTPPTANPVAFFGRIVDGVERYNCYMDGTAPNYFLGNIGLGGLPNAVNKLRMTWEKSVQNGVSIIQTGTDTSSFATIGFFNTAITSVGSIQTTAAATSYNTSSDARLKHAITAPHRRHRRHAGAAARGVSLERG